MIFSPEARNPRGQTLHVLFLLLLTWLLPGNAFSQTVWSQSPDAPPSVGTHARLKFAKGSIKLLWSKSESIYTSIGVTDFKEEIPTPYSLLVNSQNMGVEPSSGSKKLTIRYVTSSGEYQAVVTDGSTLTIPSASHTLLGPGQAVSGFVVISATYGTTSSYRDVRYALRTKDLAFQYGYADLTPDDFAYDDAGSMVVFGNGDFNAEVSFLQSGYYRSQEIRGYEVYAYSFYYDSKICGAFGAGKLVAGLGSQITSLSSSNGLVYSSYPPSSYSWSPAAVNSGFSFNRVIFENGRFVAVGERRTSSSSGTKGAVLVSADGVEWSSIIIPGTTSLADVCWEGGRWVAVAD